MYYTPISAPVYAHQRRYDAADKLSREFGVRVEFDSGNKQYLVEYQCAGSTIREARVLARKYAQYN